MEKDQKIRAAIYCRVSTVDKGQNPDVQLAPLKDYCAARKWEISGQYIDKGVSGSKDKRPELDKLMNDVRKRKIDYISVWKLDRWGRSLKHLINSLSELQSLGISFVSYSENIDLSTPAGQMMFHVIGAMAQYERSLIQERVKAVIANVRKKNNGQWGKKPLCPIDKRKVIESYIDDPSLSVRKIAKKTKLSIGTVHSTLVNFKAGKLTDEGFEVSEN